MLNPIEDGKGARRPDRKKYPVVPIRFVQACLNGHISDLDWYGFVHDYKEDCRRQLYVDERGTGGDLSDITIRCECGKFKPLIVATQNPKAALGFCKGWRPWLGNNSREQCGGGDSGAQMNRLLIRSASNAYFPQVLSVISIGYRFAELAWRYGSWYDKPLAVIAGLLIGLATLVTLMRIWRVPPKQVVTPIAEPGAAEPPSNPLADDIVAAMRSRAAHNRDLAQYAAALGSTMRKTWR
jgi:hypothetical protein